MCNSSIVTATILTVALTLVTARPVSSQDRYARLRAEMVREVVASEGITSRPVLEALRQVKRHEFVMPKHKNRAYVDVALAIGSKQTISPPFIVAYMTEALNPVPTDRVLEIGTGSGYQAAVLGKIVKDVYSIEIVKPLAKAAKKRLAKLGYSNVHVMQGDGYLGWPEHAPFDKIIVTCSPENVPKPLIEQLKEGGRMIVPLGQRYQQTFHLLRKEDGKLVQEKLIPTLFVPMTGKSEDLRVVQPDPFRPRIVNGGFEFDRNEDGKADNWHYQRQNEQSTDGPKVGEKFMRFTNAESGRLSQLLQGTAVNGQRLSTLQVSCWVRCKQIGNGKNGEQAAIVVHFYDTIRREVGSASIGPFRGTDDWQRFRKQLPVPKKAREMVIRVGLNGAVGQLDVDDLQLMVARRK